MRHSNREERLYKFKGAVLYRLGNHPKIMELYSKSLVEGQVLVRMSLSGVCRSQVMEVRGLRGPDPYVPHLLGHEGVGTVEDVGPGVTKVKVGDRVILSWIKGEGIQSEIPTFVTPMGKKINAGLITTFSELTVVSENRVYLCPDSLDDHTAAIMGCAVLTGAGLILNHCADVQPRVLLISGLGGIGLVALLFALKSGFEVYALEPDPDKRRIALELGATVAVDPHHAASLHEIRGRIATGVDFAVDCSGSVEAIELAYSLVRDKGGKLVVASHPPNGELMRINPHDLIRGREIEGTWGGRSQPDVDIPRMVDFMVEHKINLSFMTHKTFALHQISQALEVLERGYPGRPILRIAEC